MAARRQRAPRPLDAALARLAELAGKGVPPGRMAREVDTIIAAWRAEPGAEDGDAIRERIEALREQLAAGVGDAEEQLSDLDRTEAAAVRHAHQTHAALVAGRDAVEQALDAHAGAQPGIG